MWPYLEQLGIAHYTRNKAGRYRLRCQLEPLSTVTHTTVSLLGSYVGSCPMILYTYCAEPYHSHLFAVGICPLRGAQWRPGDCPYCRTRSNTRSSTRDCGEPEKLPRFSQSQCTHPIPGMNLPNLVTPPVQHLICNQLPSCRCASRPFASIPASHTGALGQHSIIYWNSILTDPFECVTTPTMWGLGAFTCYRIMTAGELY